MFKKKKKKKAARERLNPCTIFRKPLVYTNYWTLNTLQKEVMQ